MIITWLAIAVASFVGGFALNKLYPADYKWFMRLRRPRWLTFEGAIPFIWISIFIFGITSAAVLWETQPATANTWLLMLGYAILEIAILAYTPDDPISQCQVRGNCRRDRFYIRVSFNN